MRLLRQRFPKNNKQAKPEAAPCVGEKKPRLSICQF